jgi:Xaa-Pro aminopeptidase
MSFADLFSIPIKIVSLSFRKEDIVLFDMGANYYGFCSDITCSYPVSGKFTDNQVSIFFFTIILKFLTTHQNVGNTFYNT